MSIRTARNVNVNEHNGMDNGAKPEQNILRHSDQTTVGSLVRSDYNIGRQENYSLEHSSKN